MSWISPRGVAAGAVVTAALLAVLYGAAWLWVTWWTADQKCCDPGLAVFVPLILAGIIPFIVGGHVVATIAPRMKLVNVALAGACYAILGAILELLLWGHHNSDENNMAWALGGALTFLGGALGLGIGKIARHLRGH